MTITIDSLVKSVRYRVGDIDKENYTDTKIREFIENNGLGEYNLEMFQQFDTSGTGASMVFTPNPNEDERQLLILFSARAVLEHEVANSSRSAISFSNPVSNVNLTNIPQALERRIQSINKIIADKKKSLRSKNLVVGAYMETLSRYGASIGSVSEDGD